MNQSDSELLQRYVAERAEAAFAELVRRHIDLVFSAALRMADGDRTLAEDVTQNVFTDLARKSARLTRHTSLVGWLYTSARFCAGDARRSKRRRQTREQQACAMNQLQQSETSLDWEQLRPLLDEAMHSLNENDRQAVLLRFFNRLPLAEVGARLAVSENAARMRVERALEKLREWLQKRGFSSTATILATVLSNNAVHAAPVGLASTVSSVAIGAGTTSGMGGLTALLGLKGLAFVAVVVAAAVAVPIIRHFAMVNPPQQLPHRASATMVADAPIATGEAASSGSPTASAAASGPFLALRLLHQNNNRPIAGAQIDCSAWSEGQMTHQVLTTDAEGLARIYYPEQTTNLVLTTEKDGFADTRLLWQTSRGESIPTSYTLHPDPAVSLAGKVEDESGQPIAGATVIWQLRREDDAPGRLSPESHDLADIKLTTDADGHWSMKRAADDVIHRLTAQVVHPTYGSAFVDVGPTQEVLPEDALKLDQQLRDGSAVFKLAPTWTVTGSVVDQNGRLVPGAKILVGRLHQPKHRTAVTGADGSFTVDKCLGEETPITAEAEGFGPSAIALNIATNTSPIRLVMQPSQTVRLRVVDPDGAPIAGADVHYDWTGYEMQLLVRKHPAISKAQVDFHAKTDSDGHFTWTNAPSGEELFMVRAPGFTPLRDALAAADGEEHVITLTRGTTVAGTVHDASTGAPIPHFRIVMGFPEVRPFLGRTNFNWIRNRARGFDDGSYSQDLGGPLLLGGDNPGYVLKFEAPDYEPFISPVFQEGQGDIHLDVTLRSAKWSVVTVLKPNGLPAAGADVGLVSPGANLKLGQGSFVNNPLSTSLLKTELDGRFRLPGDPNVTRVIVACDDGYLDTTPASLQTNATVRLEAWGSIEGICLTNGKPAAGVLYKLALPDEGLDTVMCGWTPNTYEVETDAEGHFFIQRAPPGNLELLHVQQEMGPNGPTRSLPGEEFTIGPDGKRIRTPVQEGRTPVTVEPNQTATVTITVEADKPNPRWKHLNRGGN